jgi:hypothetical protein
MSIVTVLVIVAGISNASEPNTAANDSAPSAKDYLEFWKNYFVGEWTSKIVDGDTGRDAAGAEGIQSFRLSSTNACILLSATQNGKPDYDAVAGYDPSSKAWKEVFFMSDGSHLIQYYFATRDQLIGNPVGKTIKGKAKYILADGAIEEADIQFTVVDRDENTYIVTNRRVDGGPRPDLRMSSRRKKSE